ncbi:MAG TPA: IS110 family transposase [Ktedonobacteraceae bacterium]|nr:IS110 family transposase [Ktedonobacteraceae bacterium]
MPRQPSARPSLQSLPMLPHETVYVGVDIGKLSHVAGFVSSTLLARHQRFEVCPALSFDNSREGFRALLDRIKGYVPLTQVYAVMEVTGHYHRPLLQYLQELDIPTYVLHVQKRQKGLLKTDKRDALGLANMLYNQLDKGIQVNDPLQVVRRLAPLTPAAAQLRGMVHHRQELISESTQRKNKLTAIYDEMFPEFVRIFRDPNGPTALVFRERFPTPASLVTASLSSLQEARGKTYMLSDAKLLELQRLAAETIGTKDPARLRGLAFEQQQLLDEFHLISQHLQALETEMMHIVEHAREGQILTSIPGIGPLQAAIVIALIGTIANFEKPGQLKSYCGWVPAIAQSGQTLDHVHLSPRGARVLKPTIYLAVWKAIRMDCEWARLYERLVPIKCRYDEKRRAYVGRGRVIGRIAGQMLSVAYALLKSDQETLSKLTRDAPLPPPVLYDPLIHRKHRAGHYQAPSLVKPPKLIELPHC